jgi:3-oxoacyl-[acyl-carrier protein] reductase
MAAHDVLLLTGASSDLGLALARRILQRPDPPLVIAHCHAGLDRVEALRAQLGAGGERIRPIEADFTSSASVEAMADRILAEHGAPSQLVHFPGKKLVYERFPKLDWERFQRDMEIQLHAAVTLLQRFLPRMAKMPRAKVVFVLSSVTRGAPPKFLSMYTVLKHAQLGLMKALASEYAGTPVNVNAVSPSMIETRFLDALPEVAVRMAAAANPHGRNATPEDVLGAIELLLSPGSDFINGAEIPVGAG